MRLSLAALPSLLATCLCLAGVPAAAQAPAAPAPPAAIAAIREADLRRDLALLGGDAMRGREAGTVDEMRASMWLAEEMRKIGLVPMGEDGSWFQWWMMRRTRVSTPNSVVTLGGRRLALWSEAVPISNATADVADSAVVVVADAADTTAALRGRVVVAPLVAPPAASIRSTTNTPEYNYTRAALARQGNALARRGAAAVILVADSVAERAFDAVAVVAARGTYDVVGGVPRFVRPPATVPPSGAAASAVAAQVPIILVRRAWRERLGAPAPAEVRVRTETFETPSVNVIGGVRGADPALRGEVVLFSSHQDHDGVRYVVAGDSIWNGADDNGTTSVALLAIARAFVRQPARRTALFVYHGAEERGLLGSRYFAAHPVVPLEKIAAVLNGDMIGRNHPDTAALLGAQPPHRNSAALVDVALRANAATSRFVIDSTWDRPSHPEGWYFRSDHVPYAERKVPALFFSTNLHDDYHTPRDEPKTIDYAKLARMTRWMYMTGWLVGNAAARPAIDEGFQLR